MIQGIGDHKMSTKIFNKYGLQVTRFWGGSEKGVSYQITTIEGFVQLTQPQFVEFIYQMVRELES